MMSRRNTLQSLFGIGALSALAIGLRGLFTSAPAHAARAYEVTRTDAEWQKLLTSEQFNVLRKAGTDTTALQQASR